MAVAMDENQGNAMIYMGTTPLQWPHRNVIIETQGVQPFDDLGSGRMSTARIVVTYTRGKL